MVEKHLKNKHPSCLLYKTDQPSNQASVIQPNPSVTPVRKDILFIINVVYFLYFLRIIPIIIRLRQMKRYSKKYKKKREELSPKSVRKI